MCPPKHVWLAIMLPCIKPWLRWPYYEIVSHFSTVTNQTVDDSRMNLITRLTYCCCDLNSRFYNTDFAGMWLSMWCRHSISQETGGSDPDTLSSLDSLRARTLGSVDWFKYALKPQHKNRWIPRPNGRRPNHTCGIQRVIVVQKCALGVGTCVCTLD